MKPSEFIALAGVLAESETSGAAGYRSAVSRAYYGAFLTVLSWLKDDLDIKCKLGTVSERQVVQRYLANCQVTVAVEIGQMLANLHEYRKDADYDMDDVSFETQTESKLCVDRANRIMEKLRECRVMAVEQKVKAGVHQYRKTVA